MATFFNSQVWCSMKPLSITTEQGTQSNYLTNYLYSSPCTRDKHANHRTHWLCSHRYPLLQGIRRHHHRAGPPCTRGPPCTIGTSVAFPPTVVSATDREPATFVLRMLAAGTMLAALVQPEAAECVGTKRETCPHTCAFSLLPGHQGPGSAHQCSHAHSAPGSWGYSTAVTGQASARVPCPGQEPWRSSAGPMSMREERDAQGFIAVNAYDGAQLRVDVSDIGKMRLHDGVTASVQWPRVRGNQVVRDEFNRPEWAEVKQKLEGGGAGPGRSEPVSGKQGGAHDAKDSRRIQAAAMRQLAHDVLQ